MEGTLLLTVVLDGEAGFIGNWLLLVVWIWHAGEDDDGHALGAVEADVLLGLAPCAVEDRGCGGEANARIRISEAADDGLHGGV